MKLKQGLIIKQVDKQYILIDSGKIEPKFNGMIELNITGKEIVDILLDDTSKEEIFKILFDKYDVNEEVLSSAIDSVISKLDQAGLIIK